MTDRERLIVRASLANVAVAALLVGVVASFAPRTFYDDFPFVTTWVSLLPPYNEHLTTDVGGLQLAFGALFAWAAWRPEPALVVPLCAGWMLSQILHLVFHLGNLDDFGTGDAIAQTAALAAIIVVPAIPLAIMRRHR